MDTKDLDAIKLGGPAFTKKWWDAHKGVTMKDSGVGKALEDWVRYCPKDPEVMEDVVELQVAGDACERLKVALTRAKQSCGSLAKESKLGCDKYLAAVEVYRKKLVAAEADPIADAATWKEIQAAKPKVIALLTKMEERIDAAIKEMAEFSETAKYLAERAKARNQSGTHGGRDDLAQALAELKKGFDGLDKFVNREAPQITRLADPIVDLEAKLKTRKYDKEMRAMREAIVRAGRTEGSLRDKYTELSIAIQEADKLVTKAVKSREQVLEGMEKKLIMFWDGPQGATNLAASIADVTKQLNQFIALDAAKLSEEDKRKLSAKARKVDDERLMIDAGLTNLGNIVRQVAQETRDYVKDKDIADKLREILAGHKQIDGTVKQMDVKAELVSKMIAKM
jgi:predicted RNA-binding protein